ncbi:MAG: hypothetical protein IJQ99_10445 [Synergistaceae bacterium]|nr:hypothetical protein [Synergistaceae bacterium]
MARTKKRESVFLTPEQIAELDFPPGKVKRIRCAHDAELYIKEMDELFENMSDEKFLKLLEFTGMYTKTGKVKKEFR